MTIGACVTYSEFQAVVDSALDELVRGFTEQECATYLIKPCPTLEEMRDR